MQRLSPILALTSITGIFLIALLGFWNYGMAEQVHLSSPLILLLSFALMGISIFHVLKKGQVFRVSSVVTGFALVILLQLLRVPMSLADVFVQLVIVLTVLSFARQWAVALRFLAWGLIGLGAVSALMSLIAFFGNLSLSTSLTHSLSLMLLIAASLSLGISQAESDTMLQRTLLGLNPLLAAGVILSFNWGLVAIYFALLLGGLVKFRHALLKPTTLAMIYLPLLFLAMLIPYATWRSTVTMPQGSLSEPLASPLKTGRVLTAYHQQIQDEADLLDPLGDMQLEGKRYAALILEAPAFQVSQVQFPVIFPSESQLSLAFSLARLDSAVEQPLWFSVDVIGEYWQIRRLFLYQHPLSHLQRWSDFQVDLSDFAGQEVLLVFSIWTQGAESARGVWARMRLEQSNVSALMEIQRDGLKTSLTPYVGTIEAAQQAPLTSLASRLAYHRYVLTTLDGNFWLGDGQAQANQGGALNDTVLWFLRFGIIGVLMSFSLLILGLIALKTMSLLARWLSLALLAYSLYAATLSIPVVLVLFLTFALSRQSNPRPSQTP